MDWLTPPNLTPSEELKQAVGGHPLIARIMAARGITEPEQAQAFLDPAWYTPAPATEFPDMEKAARRLLDAVEAGQRILIWGDFDVDGQTATSLLVDGLRGLGVYPRYHVPLRSPIPRARQQPWTAERHNYGHGVQADDLRQYLNGPEKIDVLLTCDTGVAAFDAVNAAHAAGVDVLVTDHHAIALQGIPRNAYAVVATQRLPKGHALRDLPGVGVAYMLMKTVYELAGCVDEVARLLDLVALGIVADVVDQKKDTRYLLQLGMERLRTTTRTGLVALMASAGVDIANMSTDTIGFQIGPRLNAVGRLDDASISVEMLTTGDQARAEAIASQMELLNNKRKQIENQITLAALDQIERDPALANNYSVTVISGPNWHPGVIGIVASRLVEQYGKPAVVLCSEEGKPTRGSARSVPGVDIGRAIALVAERGRQFIQPEEDESEHGDFLLGYGGHPGAAGVTLPGEHVDLFRAQLSNTIDEIREDGVEAGPRVDAEIALGDVTMELAEELNRLAPFGAGNPAVQLMASNVRLVADAVFGAAKNHRRLTVEDDAGVQFVVTWWRGQDYPMPPKRFDLLFIPRINDYRGRRSLQLEWVDARPVPGAPGEEIERITVVDLRDHPNPAPELDTADLIVWADGIEKAQVPIDEKWVKRRHEIEPCSTLVIWTAPPGPAEVLRAVAESGASRVMLVTRPLVSDHEFDQKFGGTIRYAINHEGSIFDIPRVAAATGQREITVRRALELAEAQGKITMEVLDTSRVRVSAGGTPASAEKQQQISDALKTLLKEAHAFRRHFQAADLTEFFR